MTTTIWMKTNGQILTKFLEVRAHSAAVFALACDERYVYSASADKFVTRWNLEDGTQDNFAVKCDSSPYSIAVIPSKALLIIGLDNGNLHFIDLNSNKEIHFFQLHTSAIFTIKSDVTEDRLFVGDADGILSVWDLNERKLLLSLPFACGKIRDLAFCHSKNELYLACQDGKIRVVDTQFYNLQHTFFAHNDGVTSLLVEKDKLISGGKDAFLKVWDINSFELGKSIPAHNFAIYRLVAVGEDKMVSVSRDKTIKLWDSIHLNVLQRVDFKHGGHSHSVNDAVFEKEKMLITCGDDRRINFFKLES